MQKCLNCGLWQLRNRNAMSKEKGYNRNGWCSLETVPDVMGSSRDRVMTAGKQSVLCRVGIGTAVCDKMRGEGRRTTHRSGESRIEHG